MTRRLALPLAALALALLATPGVAAAKAGTPRFALHLPSPGHVTVAALEIRATSQRPSALPRRVSVGLPGARSLPPSVKVLFATRAIRIRGGYRYAALVLVVRKAGAAAAAADAAPRARIDGAPAPAPEPDLVDLIIEGGRGPWAVCRGCDRELPKAHLEDGLCSDCGHAKFTLQAVAIKNADRAKARRHSTLDDLFKRDFTDGGMPAEPVFGNPSFDPTIDTGHYDDGHSFGWGTPSGPTLPPRDVERVEIDLVQDLMDAQPQRLVTDLEVAANVDLNGDGAIGSGERIVTRVGPPVIT